MPKKRTGQTQVSVQFPDGLLAAAHVKRGEKPLNAYLCELVAKDTGEPFEAKQPGRPKKDATPLSEVPKRARKK